MIVGNMKLINKHIKVILIVLSFSINTKIYANSKQNIIPEKVLYGKYTELEVCNCVDSCFCRKNKSDPLLFVKGFPIVMPVIKTEWEKEVEYFEPRDTLARCTIIVYGKEYIIDNLIGLKSTDYTGLYDLSYAFSTFNQNKEYIILVFFDGYQMGTEQQSIYVIFEIENSNAIFRASYVANNHYCSSKVRIYRSKNGVFLKSKNLDRWR